MIGKSIKIFEELDSTNNFVKMNVSNMNHGTVILSRKQTEGRGRRDNEWMSKEGNLYFSILLKEDIDRKSIFKYIVQSSIALVKTLKDYNIDALIKYPNDCLIDGKKVSGILIESLGSFKLDYVIIGIGINVNQISFDELYSKATSMKKVMEKDYDIEEILGNFIREFNIVINTNYDDLFTEYLGYSMVLNKRISYNGEEYTISNIEKDGTIVIKNSESELRVAFSEISLKEIY